MQDTVYFLCDEFVKSNFTFDLIFYVHENSENIGFHFFFVQNLKWQPNQNDPLSCKLTKNNTPVFYHYFKVASCASH